MRKRKMQGQGGDGEHENAMQFGLIQQGNNSKQHENKYLEKNYAGRGDVKREVYASQVQPRALRKAASTPPPAATPLQHQQQQLSLQQPHSYLLQKRHASPHQQLIISEELPSPAPPKSSSSSSSSSSKCTPLPAAAIAPASLIPPAAMPGCVYALLHYQIQHKEQNPAITSSKLSSTITLKMHPR
eukprot:757130-Pelagomonas_calceolata.AAC.2